MKIIKCVETLSIIEKFYKLAKLKYEETADDRFLALFNLARKIRACMNSVILLPHEEYDVLCVPINLLYRCMITDLMTSLLISVVNDDTFGKIMHLMNIDYTKSFLKALNTNVDGRKSAYSKDPLEIEKIKANYQKDHYDDFKDCLQSSRLEEWQIKPKPKIIINHTNFSGTIESMYNVLLSFDETRDVANIYQYYKLFSQSEHFSLKNLIFNYKQDFHDNYYNKTRGFIHLGIELILKKYFNK